MTTFDNLSFELPKVDSLVTHPDGDEFEARFWAATEILSVEEVADFSGPETFLGTETFEVNWLGNEDFVFVFAGLFFDLEAAVFNAGPNPFTVEHFEVGWSGLVESVFELTRLEVAVFDGEDDDAFEDFEDNWDNDDYLFTHDDGSLVAASVNPERFGDDETDWVGDDYLFEFPEDTAERALFGSDSFPVEREDFDSVWLVPIHVQYIIEIGMPVSGTSDARWSVTVNGHVAEYKASADDSQTVKQQLADLLNGSPDPIIADAWSPPTLMLIGWDPDELPPLFEISVNLAEQDSNEYIALQPITESNWSQTGQMASIPVTS